MLRKLSLSALIFLISAFGCQPDKVSPANTATATFDGNRAFSYAQTLMSFGPRTPESTGADQTRAYIRTELENYGWQVDIQSFEYQGVLLHNIIAYQDAREAKVLIGAHYDTRQISDQEDDPALQVLPVPGANDGTSGTAVLMELARSLEGNNSGVWLVFFDGEDQGNIDNWEWSVGAAYFAEHLEKRPDNVIIIDMIGDEDLNIFREKQSDKELCDAIWASALQLGLDTNFIDQGKYAMIDDHLPFIRLGIPSCLLIDFDYPYWHTQSDTLAHISADSLQAVGDVLLEWLLNSSD
jgi:hypothetical protein